MSFPLRTLAVWMVHFVGCPHSLRIVEEASDKVVILSLQEGNTPLLYAVHGDHPHAVQELLQEGASLFGPDCYNYAMLKGSKQGESIDLKLNFI